MRFCFVESEEIEDETTKGSEIGAGIFLPSAHLIVLEGHIETPMHLVLHAPMSAPPPPPPRRGTDRRKYPPIVGATIAASSLVAFVVVAVLIYLALT